MSVFAIMLIYLHTRFGKNPCGLSCPRPCSSTEKEDGISCNILESKGNVIVMD